MPALDCTRIVKAEIVVTDHDNKPAFDEAWATLDAGGPWACPLFRSVGDAGQAT